MTQSVQLNGAYARLPAALDLLQRRAIVPEPEQGGYTTRQLARELNRRGWRWSFDSEEASATKAYPPSGAIEQTITVRGPDQLSNLILVLADVIHFDEEHGLTLWKPYRPDIVVRSPNERVLAFVEVKNRENLSGDIATAFRRNLLADNRLDLSVPFFLMVSQDKGFLWQNRSASDPYANPTIQFPLELVVAHYWPGFDSSERLSGLALELVMTRWLTDLALSRPDRPLDADQFLEGTDFLDAIRGATVDTEVPV